MKIRINPIGIYLFVVLGICSVCAWPLLAPRFQPYPEPGQYWVKTYGEEKNPFKKPDIEYRKVIAVKDGYVQYVYGKNFERTASQDDYMFRWRAKIANN